MSILRMDSKRSASKSIRIMRWRSRKSRFGTVASLPSMFFAIIVSLFSEVLFIVHIKCLSSTFASFFRVALCALERARERSCVRVGSCEICSSSVLSSIDVVEQRVYNVFVSRRANLARASCISRCSRHICLIEVHDAIDRSKLSNDFGCEKESTSNFIIFFSESNCCSHFGSKSSWNGLISIFRLI